MTTHFEHLAEQEKDSAATTPPLGSIDELQGGEHRREHAGKAIGDIGGHGKARETHELGTHFQYLYDIEKDRKSDVNSRRAASVAGSKDNEARRETERRGGGGGTGGGHAPSDVGKFYMEAKGERGSEEGSRYRIGAGIEARTRFVSRLEGSEERGGRMDC